MRRKNGRGNKFIRKKKKDVKQETSPKTKTTEENEGQKRRKGIQRYIVEKGGGGFRQHRKIRWRGKKKGTACLRRRGAAKHKPKKKTKTKPKKKPKTKNNKTNQPPKNRGKPTPTTHILRYQTISIQTFIYFILILVREMDIHDF